METWIVKRYLENGMLYDRHEFHQDYRGESPLKQALWWYKTPPCGLRRIELWLDSARICQNFSDATGFYWSPFPPALLRA